ncbi:stretch-activated cation channel Mid1 [Crepidotus variabilis]|uniref:Stretch-activated cation channel Mid1 n=1 Tax=Crepidotus variabilis TaxID=179855 RepID=A0A9P6EI36_9AGAR|nr:stretch-activated cation channel Mid1 [Crepidotus variabilis]
MLPHSLLIFFLPALVFAQFRQQLTIYQVLSVNGASSSRSWALPQSEGALSVSVALCSSISPVPRFFLTNSSNSNNLDDPGPSFGVDVFEMSLQFGQGNWTGSFPNGGVLAVDSNGASGISLEVAVSDRGPIHRSLNDLPFFGDTSSNQALIFSPVFDTFDLASPEFPNYKLPAANLSQPSPPSNPPNISLVISATSDGLENEPRTGCFLSSQRSTGATSNETLWAKDDLGWRKQWLSEGLTPSTNYTAFVVQDRTKISGPIYFATKSAAFNCPLVHSLPYCPGVAYSVPLPAPPNGDTTYTATNLPNKVTNTVISYMANFTTVLTTFACGRDWYSPLVGCDDCQREYRKWLCSISFTRCAEPSPENPDAFTSMPAAPTETGLAASIVTGAGGAQKVLSALIAVQTQDTARNENLPAFDSPYLQLQPCLEQCNQVDRACPPFVGFKCPTNNFNAAASYGVGYIDSADGDKAKGLTGVAQDKYGNVWCQMI